MRVRIVVSMIALSFSVMLSACGQEEANSVEVETPLNIEENNSIETVEEETEEISSNSIETVEEETEEISSNEIETVEVETEEISSDEIVENDNNEETDLVDEIPADETDSQTSGGGSDFATDTNLGGTEEDFMEYLEQSGFGGQYYAPGESADDGEFQLGQGGISDVPIANIQ